MRTEKNEFTGIEWTDQTWNPVTGCTKISAGCKNCYAETLSRRLHAMGNPRYVNGFNLTLHPDKLDEPRKWRKPRLVFVNSMSDILHADVPDDFILRAFRTMADCPQHTFQVLTKRPERWGSISEQVIAEHGAWPANVWPGTTLENRAVIDGTRKIAPRLAALAQAGDSNTIRMLSMEPLLGSLVPEGGTPADLARELAAARIGWVISGGEAGFGARPADLDWFREIRDACQIARIPFFHKQHGGAGVTKSAKRGGRLAELDGVLWHEMPGGGVKPDAQAPLLTSTAPA
jgi:protein gp37